MLYTAKTWDKDSPQRGIKCFTKYNKFKDPRRNAKIYKILSHLYDDSEYSIWIDANIELKVPYREMIDLLGDKDIAVLRHPERSCLYQEADVCQQWKKDDYNLIEEQIQRYIKEGFKEKQGLWFCGVIIRRHTGAIKRLNEQWWAEICRGSVRDQISFPYVFKDVVQTIDVPDFRNNKYFVRRGHDYSSKQKEARI